jgi:hypothetical protein
VALDAVDQSVQPNGVRVVKRMPIDAQAFPDDLAQRDEFDTEKQLDRYYGPSEDRRAASGQRRSGDDPRGGPQPGASTDHDSSSR